MGTLHSQPERKPLRITKDNIYDEIRDIKKISAVTDLSFDQVLSVYELLEIRRKNDLYLHNGDAFDEQISGIGSILEKLATQLDRS